MKDINPKVSIIVPVYNVERYLDRCLKSLLNQTLKEIEIILVDDGSPDRCPQICNDYATRDARIKVLHKVNGGLGNARNSGLEIATGEYVAFVDSDDYISLNMYEMLYGRITDLQADAILCGYRDEKYSGKFVNCQECYDVKIWEGAQISDLYLNMIASLPKVKKERTYNMPVWRCLYKKAIIDKYNIRFFSERDYVSEDLPFNIMYLQKCKRVVMVPEVYYTYCTNVTSLTHTFQKEKFNRFIRLYWLIKELTKNVDVEGLHSKRFLIGYTRAHLKNLVESNWKFQDKLKEIKAIGCCSIWKELNYDYMELPAHSALCHYLLIHSHTIMLYLYLKCLVLIHR